jgi:hypothetical protein
MKFLASLSAVAALGLTAAAANASITLPTNGNTVRFDGGTMVFATSTLPAANPTNGQLASPSGPIQLTSFGDVNHIVNNASSNPGTGDIGSIGSGEQLTFSLTNAYLVPTSATLISSTATETKYLIESNVTGLNGVGGPTLTLYDKTLTGSNGLNTQSYIGTAASMTIPTAVTSNATTYLQFANMANVTADVEVEFTKVAGSFSQETFVLQSFQASDFPTTGGTISASFNMGLSVEGTQIPQPGLTVGNGSAPNFVEGNYALVIGRTIPEPASLALLAVGGLLIGFRGRKASREA